MLPDRVSNPGPLTYESGALPIVLRSPAPYGGDPINGRKYKQKKQTSRSTSMASNGCGSKFSCVASLGWRVKACASSPAGMVKRVPYGQNFG